MKTKQSRRASPRSPMFDRGRAGGLACLVVDHDPQTIALIHHKLAALGSVRFATTGQVALRLLHEYMPDLLVLRTALSDMDGLLLYEILLSMPEFAGVCMVAFTDVPNPAGRRRALELGAMDHLVLPQEADLLTSRAKLAIRLSCAQRAAQLGYEIDLVTGLMGPRRLDLALLAECRRWNRAPRPLSLLLIEVVATAAAPGGVGTPVDDHILRQAARALQACAMRVSDLLVTMGQGRFALLLPETTGEGALVVARRLRHVLKEQLCRSGRPGEEPYAAVVGVSCSGRGPDGRDGEGTSSVTRMANALLLAAAQALQTAHLQELRQTRLLYLSDLGSPGSERADLHEVAA